MDRIDALLRPQGYQLCASFIHDRDKNEITSRTVVATEKHEGWRRGQAKQEMLPNYCPFCGEKHRRAPWVEDNDHA